MIEDTLPVYTLKGFRRSLASIDALPQFAILAIFSGLVTGLVILALRTVIELPLSMLLTGVILQATLQEALDILDNTGFDALYVTRNQCPDDRFSGGDCHQGKY